MKRALQILASILLLSSLATALASEIIQHEEITLSATPVQTLVNVSWEQGFSEYVSGYEYAGLATVKWAIPNSALQNINAESVKVFVKAAPKRAGGEVFFKRGQMKANEYYFTLECKLSANGASPCGENSSLERAFSVYFSAPKEGGNQSAQISIDARLEPIIPQQNGNADVAVNYEVDAEISVAEYRIATAQTELDARAGQLQLNPFEPKRATKEELELARELLNKARESEGNGDEKTALELAKNASNLAKPQEENGLPNLNAPQVQLPSADEAVASAGSAASGAANSAGGLLDGAQNVARGAISAFTGFTFAEIGSKVLGIALFALALFFVAKHAVERREKEVKKRRENDEWL